MGFNREAIRNLRLSKGMTIEEFAATVGASKQVVSTWETGACEPRVNSLAKIAAVFNLPIDHFFMDINATIVSTNEK